MKVPKRWEQALVRAGELGVYAVVAAVAVFVVVVTTAIVWWWASP